MKQIINTSVQDIADKLKASNGRLFSVTFTKKDGSKRLLMGRLGVTKGLVGGENTVKHMPNYLTVTEFNNKDSKGELVRRNVNLNTILNAKIGGKVYNVV